MARGFADDEFGNEAESEDGEGACMDADRPMFSAFFSTANAVSSKSAVVTLGLFSDAVDGGSLTIATISIGCFVKSGTSSAVAGEDSSCVTSLSAGVVDWAGGAVTRTGTGATLPLCFSEDLGKEATGFAGSDGCNVPLVSCEDTAGGAGAGAA